MTSLLKSIFESYDLYEKVICSLFKNFISHLLLIRFLSCIQQNPKQSKKTKKQKENKAKQTENIGKSHADKSDDAPKKSKAELKAERRALQVINFCSVAKLLSFPS